MDNVLKILLVFSLFLSHVCFAQGSSPIKKDTALSRKYLESGIAKFREKDYEGAKQYLELSVKSNPDNWKAFGYKGDVEIELNNYEESIKDYTKALSLNVNDTFSIRGRAKAYRLNGNYPEALDDYQKTIQLTPENHWLYYGRGDCYYHLKRYKEATEDFSRVIRTKPNIKEVYLKRAEAYNDLNEENYREVINDCSIYLKLGGDDTTAYYLRGKAYLFTGKTDSSIVDLETYVKVKQDYALAYKYLGVSYADKGDSINLRKNFKRSIEIDSVNADTYFRWGTAELNLKNYSKANELMETALRKLKAEPSFSAYYYLGLAKAGMGDVTGTIQAFDKAGKIDSSIIELYETRINLLGDYPKYDEIVLKDINKLISYSSERWKLGYYYYIRGWIYWREKRFTISFQDLDKAISLDPPNASYRVMKAWLLFLMTNLSPENADKDKGILEKEVLEELDKAIALDNKGWQAYAVKAMLYFYSEEKEKACMNVKTAIKLGGKISKMQEDSICKGKAPKNGEIPDIEIFIRPEIPAVSSPGISQQNK